MSLISRERTKEQMNIKILKLFVAFFPSLYSEMWQIRQMRRRRWVIHKGIVWSFSKRCSIKYQSLKECCMIWFQTFVCDTALWVCCCSQPNAMLLKLQCLLLCALRSGLVLFHPRSGWVCFEQSVTSMLAGIVVSKTCTAFCNAILFATQTWATLNLWYFSLLLYSSRTAKKKRDYELKKQVHGVMQYCCEIS